MTTRNERIERDFLQGQSAQGHEMACGDVQYKRVFDPRGPGKWYVRIPSATTVWMPALDHDLLEMAYMGGHDNN